MFKSVHHALTFAYKTIEAPIMPINNTASVIKFMETKGVVGRGGQEELSQHDKHAQAAMIIGRVEAELAHYPLLLATVRCQYGRGGEKQWHKGVAVLDAHYRQAYSESKCDGYGYIIRSIFMARPNKQDLVQGRMLEAFGWSLSTWQRRKAKARKDMGKYMTDSICILETIFEDNGLIQKEVA